MLQTINNLYINNVSDRLFEISVKEIVAVGAYRHQVVWIHKPCHLFHITYRCIEW